VPFYVDGKLFDAALNRAISPRLDDDFDLGEKPGGRPTWELRFLPVQCPECGWDLEGERDSFALGCRNCQSVWHAGKRRFTKLESGHLPPEEALSPASRDRNRAEADRAGSITRF